MSTERRLLPKELYPQINVTIDNDDAWHDALHALVDERDRLRDALLLALLAGEPEDVPEHPRYADLRDMSLIEFIGHEEGDVLTDAGREFVRRANTEDLTAGQEQGR